jgi:osmotically-inducible protein OsmY
VFSRPQPIPDSRIINNITRRLASCGVRAPSRVAVACVGGQVTLSGSLQHEHMRHPVLRAVRGAEGVRNVIDLLKKIVSTKGA